MTSPLPTVPASNVAETYAQILDAEGDPTEPGWRPRGEQGGIAWRINSAIEAHRQAAAAVVERAQREGNRDLLATEQRTFREATSQIRMLTLLADAYEAPARRAAAARAEAMPGGEPRRGGTFAGPDNVYRRGGRHSYFQDLVFERMRPTPDSSQRLARHAQEMDRMVSTGDMERLSRKWGASPDPQDVEYRVNPNRVDGQGGYFVPPAYLIEQYIDFARAGRATADIFRPFALPAGTDSIGLPKVASGSSVEAQTADAAAVSSTDMTDDLVVAPVRTIAGQQDFSLQLLEQSAPPGFDEVVFRDLQAAYNAKLSSQLIAGTGSNGQLLGLLNVSGPNAITYTDASPTLPELWPNLMKAASKIHTQVFMPVDAAVVNPARWFWSAAELDTANRPLLGGAGPQNAMGASNPRAAEGRIGDWGGLPVIGDANVPTNLGAGVNEDRIIFARYDECFLWEGTVRTRVLTEVLSGTLQVRVQLYNYVAAMPHRRPRAIGIISGTGLAGLATLGYV